MLARPRRGVLARQQHRDVALPTMITAGALLALASAAVLAGPSLRGRSGAATAHDDLPLGLAELLGVSAEQSFASSVGHLDATFFSVVLPAALLALTLPLAARSVARLVERGELEFLAGQAFPHRMLVTERFIGIMVAAAQATIPSVVLILVASSAGDLDIGIVAAVLATLRALTVVAFVTACACAASSLTRNTVGSLGIGVAVAVVTFGTSALGPTAAISPARWALTSAVAGGGHPLGMLAVLVVAGIIVSYAAVRFEQADMI